MAEEPKQPQRTTAWTSLFSKLEQLANEPGSQITKNRRGGFSCYEDWSKLPAYLHDAKVACQAILRANGRKPASEHLPIIAKVIAGHKYADPEYHELRTLIIEHVGFATDTAEATIAQAIKGDPNASRRRHV